MVEGLFLPDFDLRMNSYNMIKKEITTATSSMTSLPRPLKFLKEYYSLIKSKFKSLAPTSQKETKYKQLISDLISVLFTVHPDKDLEEGETMLFYVLQGTRTEITSWGQEYVRSLCADLGVEYTNRLDREEPLEEIYDLVKVIVPFLIEQRCENDAIDLLIEVNKINEIYNFVNESNYQKICLYLLSMTNFAADTEEYRETLELVYNIYFKKFHLYVDALRVAIKIGNQLYIDQTFSQCKDPVVKKQMAFILAAEKIFVEDEKLPSVYRDIMSGLKTSEYFREFAKSMEVLEPKHPEDLFKTHLEDRKPDAVLESYKINMAYSIANAFINAGYGTEVLLSKKENDWLYKNKEEGINSLIEKIKEMNEHMDIPKSFREARIEEQEFLAKVDMLADRSFEDQCTTANPRLPLVSELKQILLDSYYGK